MMYLDQFYLKKIEQVAEMMDDAFPEILMHPRFNRFDDVRYHTMDLTDESNKAVLIDPRFTAANVTAIRKTAKSMSKFLDWVSLWDDYIEYLEMTYGSVEIAAEMNELGLLPDPWPGTDERPKLRNPELRKAINAGVVPSFYPSYYSTPEVVMKGIEWLKHINALDMPDVSKEPEPDPEYRRELTAEELAYNRKMNEKFRRMERLQMLRTTAYASNAVAETRWQPGIDFIEQFYADVERGAYDDPQFTDYSDGGIIETEMRLHLQEELMTESEKLLRTKMREERGGGSAIEFRDGLVYRRQDVESKDEYDCMVHIQQQFDVDIFAAMQNGGMSKKGIKAIRTQMQDAGYDIGLTKKQKKRSKKLRKKNERAINRIASGSESLQALLNTNKLFMNQASIRFEDGWNLADFDDD